MTCALLRRLGALVLLAAAATGLHLAGTVIGHPTLDDHQGWAHVDPLVITTTLARWAALATCAWLGAVTALDSMALCLHLHPARHLATMLAPAAWRTLVLRPVAVASLALPPMAAPVAMAMPALASTVPAPGQGDRAPASQLEMRPFGTAPTALTLTMHHLEPVTTSGRQAAVPGETPGTEAVPPPTSESSTWVVGPGENLWSIAAAHLGQVWGHRPASSEVTAYWQAVIEANRHGLPDPANPDLIYPGLELSLPPVG